MTGQLAVGLRVGSGWWCRWGQESRDRRAESDMSSASSSPDPYSPPGHLHTTHIKNMRCYVLKSLIVYPVSYLTTYSVREVKPFCVYASYTIHPFVLSPLGSKTWLQYPLLLLSHCQVSLPLSVNTWLMLCVEMRSNLPQVSAINLCHPSQLVYKKPRAHLAHRHRGVVKEHMCKHTHTQTHTFVALISMRLILFFTAPWADTALVR